MYNYNMKNNPYTRIQLVFLLILRFVIGWHILYEGISKLIQPNWTSLPFLKSSTWILSDIFDWIVSNSYLLSVVDFLNVWGLIAIGLGVIFGCFYIPATISGALLLFVYYLNAPPLTGLESPIPVDGSNLIINKTLIESIALLILAVFPTNKTFGLDYYISLLKKTRK